MSWLQVATSSNQLRKRLLMIILLVAVWRRFFWYANYFTWSMSSQIARKGHDLKKNKNKEKMALYLGVFHSSNDHQLNTTRRMSEQSTPSPLQPKAFSYQSSKNLSNVCNTSKQQEKQKTNLGGFFLLMIMRIDSFFLAWFLMILHQHLDASYLH